MRMLLGLGVIACVMGAAHGQGEQTAPVPTLEPTMKTNSPTMKPTVDTSFVLAVDETFMDLYLDPFEDQTDAPKLPPAIIYNSGKMTSGWKDGSVKVAPYNDYFAFNLWHGKSDNVTSYFDEDFKIKAFPSNPSVMSQVKLQISQKYTTQVQVNFLCQGDGETLIKFTVKREKTRPISFSLTKSCKIPHATGLLVSSKGGHFAVSSGKVSSAFNVHDIRGKSFIASKQDQTDVLEFHTSKRGVVLTGVPKIVSYTPTDTMLNWIASTQPGLGEIVSEFRKKQLEGIVDQDLEFADSAEPEDDDEDDDGQDDTDEEDDAEEAISALTAGGTTPPTEVLTPAELNATETNLEQEFVKVSKEVCKPSLSGEVFQRLAKHGRIPIMQNPNIGEKQLLGFAQAGMLGQHGGHRLVVDYNCVNDGLAIIQLEFSVRLPKKRGQKREKSEKIRLSWLKVCSSKQLGPDTIDLMGFNVNLGVFAREDPSFFPIQNGLTAEPFTFKSAAIVATPQEMQTSFYVSIAEAVEDNRLDNQIFQLIRITKVRLSTAKNRHNKVMTPKLSGHGAHGGLVTSESLPLTVHYNCHGNGDVIVGVHLYLDVVVDESDDKTGEKVKKVGDIEHRVDFYWKKECYHTPITQLNAVTVNPAKFNLSSSENEQKSKFPYAQVIRRGRTTPLFSSTRVGFKKDSKSLYHVKSDQPTMAIELKKHGGRDSHDPYLMGLVFSEPILTSSNTDVSVTLRSIGEMEELMNLGRNGYIEKKGGKKMSRISSRKRQGKHVGTMLDMIEVTKEDPVYLVVDHECRTSSSAVITLQIPLYGNTENMVTMKWIKKCNWSDHTFDAKQTGGFVIFFTLCSVAITAACFCVALRRQRRHISYLESKDKLGFSKMSVVSSL